MSILASRKLVALTEAIEKVVSDGGDLYVVESGEVHVIIPLHLDILQFMKEKPSDPKAKRQCTRNGCENYYTEEENSDHSCVFHPGVPVFHEGLKVT